MNRRSGAVVALCFPLVLLLGACSSSSKKTTDSAAGTVAVETAPADTASTDTASTDTAEGGVAANTIAADGDFNAADVTFAQGMIPHHRQAVEMSTIALDPARNAGPKVQDLAKRIQGAQDPEIELMTGWLKDWGQPVDAMAGMEGMEGMDMGAMPGMEGMMSADEMTALAKASGPGFDKAWLEMMVRHHAGAVTMSKTLQGSGKSAAAKELAGKIISAQEAEIAEMNALLAA